jgi:hypothetical protein
VPRCRPRATATPTTNESGCADAHPLITPKPAITRAAFVQLELAGKIGLPEGRYLVRDGDRERVLIVQELGAPRPKRRAGRFSKPVEAGDPEEVPVTRVTVTGERLPDSAHGSAWLKEMMGSGGRGAEEVRRATRIVNRALSALRAAARDPLVQDIGATRALAVRLGHGSGDELAEGQWTEARELARPRRGRLDDVDPQSRVAAVLAGRDEVHPAETLMLRARLDAQQGRLTEARYGLRAARTALQEQPAERRKELLEELAAVEEKLGDTSGP